MKFIYFPLVILIGNIIANQFLMIYDPTLESPVLIIPLALFYILVYWVVWVVFFRIIKATPNNKIIMAVIFGIPIILLLGFSPFWPLGDEGNINDQSIKSRSTLWCMMHPESKDKARCYTEYAQLTGDIGACDAKFLIDYTEKVSGSRNYGFGAYTRGVCITSIATRTEDATLCNKLKGKDIEECKSSVEFVLEQRRANKKQ